MEHPFQKRDVAWVTGVTLTPLLSVDLEHPPGSPGMDRRIHVAKRPFIGGKLPVGIHHPFPGQQDELLLGESWIQPYQGNAVEGQVPGREPREFPFVGHRKNLADIEVVPVCVAAMEPLRRRSRLSRVTRPPDAH